MLRETHCGYYTGTFIALSIVYDKLLLINKISNDFIINPTSPYIQRYTRTRGGGVHYIFENSQRP